jgi:hypothetical protein
MSMAVPSAPRQKKRRVPLSEIPPLVVEVEVDGLAYKLVPSRKASIDRANLEEEFLTLPKTLTQWIQLSEKLSAVCDRLVYEKKTLHAKLDKRSREEALNAGVKLTEKMVENTVITHHLYQEHMEKIFLHQEALGMIRAGVEGQRAKKDMLISIGANVRSEGAFRLKEEESRDTKRKKARSIIRKSQAKAQIK